MRGTVTRSVGKSGTVLALLARSLSLSLSLSLSWRCAGCESFGRGVTEAVLEGTGEPAEDNRNCEVEGRPFPGIEPYLRPRTSWRRSARGVGDRPEVKVLYVHGIGTHVPGDGTALRQTSPTRWASTSARHGPSGS